jgi:hypothetical protein
MFLLYDYSFSPPGLSPQQAIAWAAESGIRCTDETYLFKEPHEDAAQWCRARLESTQQRLATIPAKEATVLINHFPLKADLVRLFKIPRFSPWCGTTATESWHIRYRAKVVVSGHLHMRATDWRGPCRFEEVSVGYPKHWHQEKTMNFYLREILPGPPNTDTYPSKPQWRF